MEGVWWRDACGDVTFNILTMVVELIHVIKLYTTYIHTHKHKLNCKNTN